jgi:hypothetical protein
MEKTNMSGKSFGPDWRPDEPLLLEEAGVIYSFDAVDGWASYSYKAEYLPLGLTIDNRRVYTDTRENFEALLAHWNRAGNWSYNE